MPENWVAGSTEKRGDLGAGERGHQHAVGRHRDDIDQHAQEQGRKTALERNLEDEQGH